LSRTDSLVFVTGPPAAELNLARKALSLLRVQTKGEIPKVGPKLDLISALAFDKLKDMQRHRLWKYYSPTTLDPVEKLALIQLVMACKIVDFYLRVVQQMMNAFEVHFEDPRKTLGEYTVDELIQKGNGIVASSPDEHTQWEEWKVMIRNLEKAKADNHQHQGK
jgi:hypothetical protein